MFKAIRIGLLLFLLFFVGVSAWLTKVRSTDWENSLRVSVYPINADGSQAAEQYIDALKLSDFAPVEVFMKREATRYGKTIERPIRLTLGTEIREQPPALPEAPNMLSIALWSLKMRWWSGSITSGQDPIEPHVRIFVRFHTPSQYITLENSVGLQKGMVGIVNGYASRRQRGTNNVIVAHELLHTLGATDKYSMDSGHPVAPDGIAEPGRTPLYPQRYAEIMGGRIALAADDSVIPKSLKYAVIGPLTASEINFQE